MENIIEDTFDIFLISKTKTASCFPKSQFAINEYRILQRNRNYFRVVLCLYIKDSILSKQLNSHKEKNYVEGIYL